MSNVPEVVILGAGGHCHVLIDLISRDGSLLPIAVLDPESSLWGSEVLGVPIRGDDSHLGQFDPSATLLLNGVGSVRSTEARRDLYLRARDAGFEFATVVHPRADIGQEVDLGSGVQVMSGVVINTGAVIEENCLLNTGAIVEHDCRVGRHSHVATGATLAGGVRLEDGVHLGAGATVIQGVTIGSGTVVGAGAVVVRDLPSHVLALGVPARIVTRHA